MGPSWVDPARSTHVRVELVTVSLLGLDLWFQTRRVGRLGSHWAGLGGSRTGTGEAVPSDAPRRVGTRGGLEHLRVGVGIGAHRILRRQHVVAEGTGADPAEGRRCGPLPRTTNGAFGAGAPGCLGVSGPPFPLMRAGAPANRKTIWCAAVPSRLPPPARG